MEGSRLPLRIWFMAIDAVLADPAIRPERLQQAIELPRGSARSGGCSEPSWSPSSHPTPIVCWPVCSALRHELCRLTSVTHWRAI